MNVAEMITAADGWLWGYLLTALIMGTGVLLTIRTGGVQLRHLGLALRCAVQSERGGSGEVSSFGALCTALSATIGTGNIVGVATAIAAGGPGALFWMVVAAFFGMATKYAEGLLAVKYRTVDKGGHALGGPFYYIERGLAEVCPRVKSWRWLGKCFALFGTLAGIMGIGTVTQVSGIVAAAQRIVPSPRTAVICGAVVTLLAAAVIMGGARRIARVSEIVVPFMAVLYIILTLTVVVANADKIPAAARLIVRCAFSADATGGAIKGLTLQTVIRIGVGRGVFSNEAGLGSAPIAAAAARTRSAVRQGLVSMTGTFIDTIVLCTLTGLTIVLTGSWTCGADGFGITAAAWQAAMPFGKEVCTTLLSVCLIFFAFTSMLGWNYYSERCFEYLAGGKRLNLYRTLYIAAVAVGPYLTAEVVWGLADIFNGLMALPNLLALLLLSGVVRDETKYTLKRR